MKIFVDHTVKKNFNRILKHLNESNLIPLKIKESIKEEILNTYTKCGINFDEYFELSDKNFAVWCSLENRDARNFEEYGDYGLLYEFENIMAAIKNKNNE